MRNLERDLIDKAKKSLVSELKIHGLSEEVSNMLVSILTEESYKLSDILGDFIS